MNITDTIEPKVDQLTADHLIGRTMTIKITGVHLSASEQPCELRYEGDNGLPYRPGKSMRRVLVHAWGGDVKEYTGRSLRLYRDDDVQFGGLKVGGIRISHMSHISGPLTLALTAKKGSKKAFKVAPLPPASGPTIQGRAEPAPPPLDLVALNSRAEQVTFPSAESWLRYCRKALDMLEGVEAVREWMLAMRPHIEAAPTDAAETLRDAAAARVEALTPSMDHDEGDGA